MPLIPFTIRLSDLSFKAFHGVLPQERKVGNNFLVSLSVEVLADSDLIASDQLSATVSYADLYLLIEHEMKIPADLIENVALRIANRIKSLYPEIESGEISVTKVNPPISGCTGSASVSLKF